MNPTTRSLPTRHGPAEIVTTRARRPLGSLVVTHGAGGGVDARDLAELARVLPAHGVDVHRLVMPWRVAGKKLAPRPTILDECFLDAMAEMAVATPFVIGGRSAGARAACRTAAETGALGVLALSFPLHPPGKPASSRLEELTGVDRPVLVVQGGRDPFGTPAEFPASTSLVEIPFADHGFKVPARADITQAEALELLADGVRSWLRRLFGN